MIDGAIELMLDDWGRWCREQMENPHHCRSMEGSYRHERVAGDTDAPVAPIPHDQGACMAVERAVCNPDFPAQARALLKGWYVLRASRDRIASHAGIPRSSFAARMDWAVWVLRNRLDHAIRASLSSHA